MAFNIESTSSLLMPEESSTMTWSHTVTAANLLIVIVSRGQSGGSDTISTVTWNGAGLSLVLRSETAGQWGQVEIWKLNSPTPATGNVVVTFAGIAETQAKGWASGFTDASLTLGATGSGGGTTANPSINVTTVAGDIVIGGYISDVGDLGTMTAVGTSLGESENIGGGDSDVDAQRITASGTSTAFGWTCSVTGEHWQIGAVAISSGIAAAPSLSLPRAEHAPRTTRTQFGLRRLAAMPLDVGPRVPTPFAPMALMMPPVSKRTRFILQAIPLLLEYPAAEPPVIVQFVPPFAQRNVRHSGRH